MASLNSLQVSLTLRVVGLLSSHKLPHVAHVIHVGIHNSLQRCSRLVQLGVVVGLNAA